MNDLGADELVAVRTDSYLHRVLCRSLIRRIRQQHPESCGYELFLRLWAACPSSDVAESVQQIWFEEVMTAVGGIETIRASLPSFGATGHIAAKTIH